MKIFVLAILLLSASYALAQPPYEPVAIWEREGACDTSFYGEAILALGDQNDDGFNDWAVYAFGWGPPGQPCEPKVEFFHGDTVPTQEPYMVRITETPEEEYIWGARELGDLNDDGYVDWCIFTNDMTSPEHPRICKVYHGGPGGHENPDLVIPIMWAFPLGDFNGDGYDDIYLSAWVILYGGDPMDILPDWTRNISLGYVSGGGDVNHDGFSDFISCCNGSGYVDVYLGGEEPDTIPAYHWLNSTSTPAIIRDMNNDDFDDLCVARSGWGEVLWGGDAIDSIEDARLDFPCSGGPEPGGPDQIISAGDFNHDGYNDIVMLNNYCPDSWYGTLTLHLGSPWIYSNPTFVIYGWTEPLNLIHIKRAVGLGDVNGDGWDDFSVGANGTPEHDAYRGKAAVLRGDTSLHVAADEPFVPLPAKLEVSVYPNPFNNAALIELSLPAYTIAVDLTIFNLLGQEIFREEILPTSSKFVYHYDAGDLSTGLYLLRVNSGNLQTTTKLMVLK